MNRRAKSTLRAAIASLAFAAIAACGGGGGGGGGDNGPTPPPAIHITTSTLADGTVNVPYHQTISATGGTGARSFSISAGSLPASLTLDAGTGVIAGSPAGPAGLTGFTVLVEDSASPRQDDSQALSITINAAAIGRNDSIADATPIGNGTYAASISPSGDPSTIFDPDEDYYSITTTADSTVTVDINAAVNGSPFDSVIEIVGANGQPLMTCGAPAFNSICQHDDEDTDAGLLDSFLQVRVTGSTTFYVHVADWGSNARPDKLYDLVISGVN